MNILSRAGIPLFTVFFLWTLGSAALTLARPLFAAELGANVFFVTLVISVNSFASLVSGPLIGFAVDRWGRKPVLILGASMRAASGFLQFVAPGYVEFTALEFFGGIGVAMFVTGSVVLMADVTNNANRGRALAARQIASRLGAVAGPALGALVATQLGLRAVFLYNGISKLCVVAVLLLLIAETRPGGGAEQVARRSVDLRQLGMLFRTRAFAMIALVAFSLAMMGHGVFSAQLPLALKATGNFSTADIGVLLTAASLATLLVSYPNGMLVDRFGRKSTLVPGLALLGLAAYLFTQAQEYAPALFIVVAYGSAEGMVMGAAGAYAMDLAPVDRRGSFLGIWQFWQSLGSTTAPLLVALFADRFGFGPTFTGVAVYLLLICILMWSLGPDTRSRAAREQVVVAT